MCMHACMHCNVCVCMCYSLCNIVLHICALFFFTLFSLFSYDLKFLQGKRRPQEMLWNCTAWSTNFLKLGYIEIPWMFAHVYFLQLLDNCWWFLLVPDDISQKKMSAAGALEKIMVKTGAPKSRDQATASLIRSAVPMLALSWKSTPFRGDWHACIRKRASLGFGRIIVSSWTLPRRWATQKLRSSWSLAEAPLSLGHLGTFVCQAELAAANLQDEGR